MLAGCECEVKRQKYSARRQSVKRIGKIFWKKGENQGKYREIQILNLKVSTLIQNKGNY